MPVAEPADKGVRQEIIEHREESVVVEASAGTGKTTLLTGRVVSMVREGTPLERLAVVTFNDTAAGELRLRIRENLKPCHRKNMDQAWICTMHSFASRVLREYYYLIGGVPEFSTVESHFSRTEIEMCWDLFLAGTPAASLVRSETALRHPGTKELLDIASALEEHRWISDTSVLGDTPGEEEKLIRRWTTRLTDLPGQCTDKTDLLFRSITAGLLGLKDRRPIKIGLGGRQASWGGRENLNRVKEIIREYQAESPVLMGYSRMESILPCLEELVIPFLNHLRRRWDADPTRLSFDDLLYRAGQGVKKSPLLRKALSERFDHILIDEFQDTSLVQVNLFRSILQGDGLQRKLTVVGDPKQSIYGWRSADIETYKTTVEQLEKGGALSKTITVNFRSAESIIRFVNSFGEALFSQAPPGELPFSSGYSPIDPRPGAPEGEGVHVHRLPDLSAGEQARAQALAIGELIGDPGNTAVLLRSTTHMDSILREFDRMAIPYSVEASRDFHRRAEVEDTACLLRSLLNREDTFSLVNTLRSIYFGLDDREITAWRVKGEASKQLGKALELIEKLRTASRTLSPGLFVKTLYRNTCILRAIGDSGHQTGRRLSNMQFLLEQAQSIDDCTALLELLEGKAPMGADEPSAPPENSLGAVTVTTIHRAKGLAWKHVILASPGGNKKGRTEKVLTDERTERAAIKVEDGFTAHWPDLKEREANRGAAEFRRLLYVAVTRPRDRLDIFLPGKSSPGSPGAVLEAALADPEHYTETEVAAAPEDGGTQSFPAIPDGTAPGPFEYPVELALQAGDDRRDRAMRLGTEVHSVMEFIDLNAPEEWLEKRLSTLSHSLEFPERTINLVKNFFRAFDLTGAAVLGREYPITARGSQYYVDLLLERNGCLEAVDYKTDLGDPAERMQFYEEHQRLYMRTLRESTGKPVKAFLVFLQQCAVFEIREGPGD